ncbi:glycosyl transferase family 1 [Deinococcus koreensis]|uniref:Glycosyl transferase family 1 n=1 Tax=Deinococcus koreensis TaxID=2054903 RepID=A0A2K3V2J8_9DEIO|nr:glycosyl transferase family 1 [Deinococcus koreensis]
MKIVFVITRGDSVGGAHIHVRDLSRQLMALGHHVTVVVGGAGAYTAELERAGIPFRSLQFLTREIRPRQEGRALLELRGVLAELRPDLVSTHSSKAGLLGRLAARSLGVPALFTAHGWAFTEGVPESQRRFYTLAERLLAPLSRRIITVSEHDRQLALRRRVAPAHRLVTVHNGMPLLSGDALARPQHAPPTLVMVARFQEQKDHATLLRALAGLQTLPWTLELIGDGPLEAQTMALAAELGLAARVQFLGARSDVAERLRSAQIFVLATHWEGFPRSILEAMRAGLPVVASDVGGVRESVEDGVTGRVVPPADVDALRLALAGLIGSPQERQRLGDRGREVFLEQFTFTRMFAQTLEVYQQVLGRPLTSPATAAPDAAPRGAGSPDAGSPDAGRAGGGRRAPATPDITGQPPG